MNISSPCFIFSHPQTVNSICRMCERIFLRVFICMFVNKFTLFDFKSAKTQVVRLQHAFFAVTIRTSHLPKRLMVIDYSESQECAGLVSWCSIGYNGHDPQSIFSNKISPVSSRWTSHFSLRPSLTLKWFNMSTMTQWICDCISRCVWKVPPRSF